MWKSAQAISATQEQKEKLITWVRCGTTQQRVAFRCHIVLRAIEGKSNNTIAKELFTSRPTVIMWRNRFEEGGPQALLKDLPRGQRIPPLPKKKIEEVVSKTLNNKPKQQTHWSCRSMARECNVQPLKRTAHLGCPWIKATFSTHVQTQQ